MKQTKHADNSIIQRKLLRRYPSTNSLSTGMLFKCLVTISILLTFFIVRADNQPVDAESTDAMFIDQKGNVGIGTNQPSAKLDVKGTLNASKFTRDGLNPCVPIGTIMAYGGDVTKKEVIDQLGDGGWLVCDGNEVKRDEYPELFKAIRVSFGAGDDQTTFHLPDMRGRFLRGVDHGSRRDPDAQSRVASNKRGNTGDNVGSLQMDEFGRHDHPLEKNIYKHGRSFKGEDASDHPLKHAEGDIWITKTNISGGSETRPKNIYVNWIIKAK